MDQFGFWLAVGVAAFLLVGIATPLICRALGVEVEQTRGILALEACVLPVVLGLAVMALALAKSEGREYGEATLLDGTSGHDVAAVGIRAGCPAAQLSRCHRSG